MISPNAYFFEISDTVTPLTETMLGKEWNDYNLQEGVDKWTEYGDDIQFRTVSSGPAQCWWMGIDHMYELPERHRDPQFIRFGPSSSVPIHKDPKSLAWIAVTIVGDQPLEFYNDVKTKLFSARYKFALVNSKQPHYCDVKGKERVLFRKIYTETSYDTLLSLLND